MVNIESPIYKIRRQLSEEYIHGQGIEIGALHSPLYKSEGVNVKYLDYVSRDILRTQYPELSDKHLVNVDIIDNGELLNSIEDDTCDFIIANHFIEHCENPIGTIRNHLSKLKSGGILFYAIPNKKYTFDIERELTTFKHLVLDDSNGVEFHRDDHFLDYFENVLKVDVSLNFEELKKRYDHIHYHVWDSNSFFEFISKLNEYLGYAFEVECFMKNGIEIIIILRKVESINNISYKSLINEVKKISQDREIYIWGTGKAGKTTYEQLIKKDIKIKGFIDSNKQQELLFGLDILDKAELEKIKDIDTKQNNPFIIIGSGYYEEIVRELVSIGLVEFKDFIRNIMPL